MKLKIELSCREDNHLKKYKAMLMDSNIVVDNENKLPNTSENFINFICDYSPTYNEYSKGIVNTRLRYICNSQQKGNNYIYAKLNWVRRQKLYYIARQSWFHKYPIIILSLLINSLFALGNLYFAYQNHQNSVRNVQDSYLETITNLIEIQKLQAVQYQEQEESLLNRYKTKDTTANFPYNYNLNK